MPLHIKVLYHENCGILDLSINGWEYRYFGDNAIMLELLKEYRRPHPINMGEWLQTLKRTCRGYVRVSDLKEGQQEGEEA